MKSAYTPALDGFYPVLKTIREKMPSFEATGPELDRALERQTLSPADFASLLSPAAGTRLEGIARRAHGETLRHFGRTVQLFAPLYLANLCTNRCVYCGFHAGRTIRRSILSPEEIAAEAEALFAMGLRRVLVLTGDAPKKTGADYIANAVSIVARTIPSVGIEVPSLTREEYRLVSEAGCDSLTMFQETYDEALYASLHPAGPKRDFGFRLDAPHRAVAGGMRCLTFGALLGLSNWREDIYCMAMHVAWVSRFFPHVEVAVSLPRVRPRGAEEAVSDNGAANLGYTLHPVPDRDFVQALLALRCFLPHAGITISSRESAPMRDSLIPLGVTRVSAGVKTSVGGYAAAMAAGLLPDLAPSHPEQAVLPEKSMAGPVQFLIDDPRSVREMSAAINRMGYHPVLADWLLPDNGTLPLSGGVVTALGDRPRTAV